MRLLFFRRSLTRFVTSPPPKDRPIRQYEALGGFSQYKYTLLQAALAIVGFTGLMYLVQDAVSPKKSPLNIYKRKVRDSPDNVEGISELGFEALSTSGELQTAIEQLSSALRKRPNSAAIVAALTEAYLIAGDYQNAFRTASPFVESLDSLAASDPATSALVVLRYGAAVDALGLDRTATFTARSALADAPYEAFNSQRGLPLTAAAVVAARQAAKEGDFAAAEGYLERCRPLLERVKNVGGGVLSGVSAPGVSSVAERFREQQAKAQGHADAEVTFGDGKAPAAATGPAADLSKPETLTASPKEFRAPFGPSNLSAVEDARISAYVGSLCNVVRAATRGAARDEAAARAARADAMRLANAAGAVALANGLAAAVQPAQQVASSSRGGFGVRL